MSFFDRILQSLENFFTGAGREVDEPVGSIPIYTEKFVSGLFYCNGEKKQFYALTIEDSLVDREIELLESLSEAFPNCSDMRENHGYSEKEGVEEPEASQEYPNIEIGEL